MPKISINQEEIELQQNFLKQNPDLSSKLSEATLFIWFFIQNTVFRQGPRFQAWIGKRFQRNGKIFFTDYNRELMIGSKPLGYYCEFTRKEYNSRIPGDGDYERIRIEPTSVDALCKSSEALAEILLQRPLVYYFNVRNTQTDQLHLIKCQLTVQSGPVFLECRNSYRKMYYVAYWPEIPLSTENGEIVIPGPESLNCFVIV